MGWESLSFADRQKQWTGAQRSFRQNNGRGDRATVWEIRVDGDRVFTRHGLLGGAMQQTDYVGKVKNKGKQNEISAEQDAMAEARRDVLKKWDFEGYDEYVGETNIDMRNQNVSVMHLLASLPGSFCLYKPENTFDDQKKLVELAKKGKVAYTLKRDGLAHWVVVDYYGNVQIYSRRNRPWSDTEEPPELPDGTLDYSKAVPWAHRFPHLVDAVKSLGLPPGTMMACELVTHASQGENFRYISGLTKGYTDRALADMAAGGYPVFYWWDVPFYGGEDLVSTKPVNSRHQIIHDFCNRVKSHYIQPVEIHSFANPEQAIAHAKANKLEGYVVVDPTAVYGDKGWNLKGKPDRPSICAKLKPWYEDDFIAVWDPDKGKKLYGEWGTGKHEKGKTVTLPDGSSVVHGGVGALALYQLNSKGEMVFISKCSSGMDYAFQAKLRASDFPMVVEAKYVERTYISDGEDTNAVKFPGFVRVRTDKKPEECVNDRL
jgi:ATP-dependent DNA ligase